MESQLHDRLLALTEQYTEAVNAAIGEGRDDIVADLVVEYPDAAMRMLSEAEYLHTA